MKFVYAFYKDLSKNSKCLVHQANLEIMAFIVYNFEIYLAYITSSCVYSI